MVRTYFTKSGKSIYIETLVGDARESLWRKEFQNKLGEIQTLVLINGAYVSLENAESLILDYKKGDLASDVISKARAKPYVDRHRNPKVGGRILYYHFGDDGSQIFGCSALVESIIEEIGKVKGDKKIKKGNLIAKTVELVKKN